MRNKFAPDSARGNEPFSTAEAGLKEEWRMQRPGSLIQAFLLG